MTDTLDTSTTTTVRGGDPTIGFRRVAGAIALPAAFALQAATNLIYSWVTRNGGGDTGAPEDTITFYASYPAEIQIASAIALLGCLVVIPGVLAALRVLRPSRPRLSLFAGLLMIGGYVAYFGIVFTNFLTLALAQSGVAEAPAILLAGQDSAFAMPFLYLFVIGNLLGTVLLGLAVILSRDLPWWAGVLILGWPVGHITNLVVGSEWFAVAGGALEVAGLAIVAAAALRLTNAEWAARG